MKVLSKKSSRRFRAVGVTFNLKFKLLRPASEPGGPVVVLGPLELGPLPPARGYAGPAQVLRIVTTSSDSLSLRLSTGTTGTVTECQVLTGRLPPLAVALTEAGRSCQ
jgi:hypothetical protein